MRIAVVDNAGIAKVRGIDRAEGATRAEYFDHILNREAYCVSLPEKKHIFRAH